MWNLGGVLPEPAHSDAPPGRSARAVEAPPNAGDPAPRFCCRMGVELGTSLASSGRTTWGAESGDEAGGQGLQLAVLLALRVGPRLSLGPRVAWGQWEDLGMAGLGVVGALHAPVDDLLGLRIVLELQGVVAQPNTPVGYAIAHEVTPATGGGASAGLGIEMQTERSRASWWVDARVHAITTTFEHAMRDRRTDERITEDGGTSRINLLLIVGGALGLGRPLR